MTQNKDPADFANVLETDELTECIDLQEATRGTLADGQHSKRGSLVVLVGQDIGRAIRLDNPQTVIGRNPECDEILHGEGVSRQHVRIVREDNGLFHVEDLGSTNGTFVRGQRVNRTALMDGDQVFLGRKTVLKFMLQDDLEQMYFKEMYESSTRDGLTGIYNKKYLIEKIIADLSFARRHRIPFSLLMFDLDYFKKINDTYGHQTGDLALLSVTKVVGRMIRAEDTFARYGGEEFAVVAQGTDFEGATILAERIRKSIEDESVESDNDRKEQVRVTVSIGVVTVPPPTVADSAAVISLADTNLYEAKNTGRNRVVASSMGR